MAKSARHDHPVLAKKLYVILSTRVGEEDAFWEMLPEHIEHQMTLEKSGVLFAAGPLVTEGGDMRGFIVIRASSFEEARALADRDPLHQKGMRTYELLQWTLNEGSFSMRVRLSNETLVFD